MSDGSITGQRQRRRTRSLPLPSMVLSKKDIYNLSKVILNESSVEGDEFSVSVFSKNGMVTEVYDLSVFSDADIIDTYPTERINIKLRSYRPFKLIAMELREGNYSTSLEIAGDDPQWVDAVSTHLSELTASIPPQNEWYDRLRGVLKHIMRLSFGYAATEFILMCVFYILTNLDISLPESPQYIKDMSVWRKNHPYAGVGVDMLSYYWFGYACFDWVIRKFDDMHPRTEFDFGPSFLNKNKKNRMILYWVIAVVLMPVLTNIISSSIINFGK